MQDRDTWITAVSQVLAGYLFKGPDDRFDQQGSVHLAHSLGRCFDHGLPVRLVLPGFPCKSPNAQDQTFGALPDYGEVMAIERLDQLGQAIGALHAPGCVVSILSDGTTFNDIVGVSDDVREAYNLALRDLCVTHTIQWVSMQDLFPSARSADSVRASLVKQARLACRTVEALIEQSRHDEALSRAHDKLCSHLYNDLRLLREPGQSEDDYLQQISFKAYQMMHRGQALNAAVERYFGDDIRLSVHPYDNAGPKFSVALAQGLSRVDSPWHAVPVCNLDGTQRLLAHSQVDPATHVAVTFEGRKWLYHQTDGAQVAGFEFELQKLPLFGLVIRDPLGMGVERLSTTLLESLVETFGFVCLKGRHFDDKDSFTRDCERFGTVYQWSFGAVQVVKPADKPQGMVHSLEKTPVHWDLSMLPDTDEQVRRDPKFCASKFMLYCKTAPQRGEGETTIIDSRNVLRKVGQAVTRQWQAVDITYYTKMTYFGGSPHTYALVDHHPRTGELILRYQEGTDSALQSFSQRVEGYDEAAQAQLIEQLDALIYDDTCMIKYPWSDGDLVLIDNYRTLHGRLPMSPASAARELWRVQVY